MERDTDPGQASRYCALLTALPGARRLELAAGLSQGVRALAEAGLRDRHPGIPEAEVRWRLAELLYGSEAATRWLGPCRGARP